MKKPEVVCLCGSTRFMEAFFAAGWTLTLANKIVLSVGVCKHAEDHGGEALGEKVARRLDRLHFRKIDLADWVLILNVNGYIGSSTMKEIKYAARKRKRIIMLFPLDRTTEPPELLLYPQWDTVVEATKLSIKDSKKLKE